jgi:hypothetical protein
LIISSTNSDSVTAKIDLIWSYLVKFPGKPIPGKQTIAVTMDSGIDHAETIKLGDGGFSRVLRLFIFDNESSEISINIAYTEVTWGIDVLRHLEGDLTNRVISENKIITRV